MKNDNPIYDEIKNILADRFAAAVYATNKRPAEVARYCGVSRQNLAKYMNGINTIPIDVTMVVANLSETDVHYLLGKDITTTFRGQ